MPVGKPRRCGWNHQTWNSKSSLGFVANCKLWFLFDWTHLHCRVTDVGWWKTCLKPAATFSLPEAACKAKCWESAHPALNEWAADGSYDAGSFIADAAEGFVFDSGLHWLRPLRMFLGKAACLGKADLAENMCFSSFSIINYIDVHPLKLWWFWSLSLPHFVGMVEHIWTSPAPNCCRNAGGSRFGCGGPKPPADARPQHDAGPDLLREWRNGHLRSNLGSGHLDTRRNTEGIWIQPLGIFPEVPKNGGNMWEFPWQLVNY